MYNKEFIKGCVELLKEKWPDRSDEELILNDAMSFYASSLAQQIPMSLFDRDGNVVFRIYVHTPEDSYFQYFTGDRVKVFTLKDGIQERELTPEEKNITWENS